MSNSTEILDELKAISPVLFKLKKEEQTISIPANYFVNLENVIFEHIQARPGILSSINKQKQEVPERYFDTFSDILLAKIKTEESILQKGKIIPIISGKNSIIQLFSRAALAASVIGLVVVLGASLFNNQSIATDDCKDGIACLTQEEIYNYMYKNSYDFDVHQVQDMVKPEITSREQKTIEINKQEINQYIEQNAGTFELEDASTDIF
ncbi:MAG: hypothetical protein IPM95_15785 [Sphingobacteriales bacterium]|jgi:hypothetical protein|nr:hypothetical protein [Sphingobacteriales bacterium]